MLRARCGGTTWAPTPGTSRPLPGSAARRCPRHRAHASHKGSYGDVAVVGGEGLAARGLGMAGAPLLAASAALHSGAGRVLVALLDNGHQQLDPQQPELMFRRFDALALEQLTVVCGCGGGQAIAQRAARGHHPRRAPGAGCRCTQQHRHRSRTARAGGGTWPAWATHGHHPPPAGGRPPAGPEHRRGPGRPAGCRATTR